MKTLRDIDWSKCKTNPFRGCDTRAELDSDGDPRVVFTGCGGTSILAVNDMAHGGWLYQLVYDRELGELREICRQVDSFIALESRETEKPSGDQRVFDLFINRTDKQPYGGVMYTEIIGIVKASIDPCHAKIIINGR